MAQTILKTAFKRRCPQCGHATLFESWNRLNARCRECGVEFIKDHIDYLIVIYFSTAVITGVFVVFFLIIGFPSGWVSRAMIILLAVLIMWLSLPYRKALAVAIDFRMRAMQ